MTDDMSEFLAEFTRRVQDKMDVLYIETGGEPITRGDDGLHAAFLHITAGVLSYLTDAAAEVGQRQAFGELMNAIADGWDR